jgi:ABC-type dipeptide/oligopeptide/nickel transport system permease component
VTRFFAARVAQALATMLMAVVLVFFAVRLLPNNPVLARYGQHAVTDRVDAEMKARGWDRPAWEQLVDYLGDVFLRGDLGESFFRPGESVTAELLNKVPATIELTIAALALAIPLGIFAGVVAAVWRGRFPDVFFTTSALLGVSIPVFFLGICLLRAFTNMPTGFRLGFGADFQSTTGFLVPETLLRGRPDLCVDALWHLCLPAIALSTIPMAVIARITRSSMLEVLSADYVRTASSKGASRWRVIWRHAFPNAAVPVVNIAGFQVGALLTGAVLTETVFSWPGMGRYLVEAVKDADYAVVQGGALVIAAVFVSTNLILDGVYLWLDPRTSQRDSTS